MRMRLAKNAGLVLVLVLTAETARAAESSVPQFQKGDRVCFIGDSISHDGAYPSYVYLFYATRFPDRRWEISNAGLGGDTAGGAVKRFDWDIAANKPTVATILLGMNDVNRGLYGVDKRGAEIEKQRQSALDEYTANMRKLAGLLEQADCRIVFLTPSSFDQTAGKMQLGDCRGVNDGLAKCAEILRGLAGEFNGSCVDFHGPMTDINVRQQAKDPAFSLNRGDRVHPEFRGHLVMAYLLLKAQGMPSLVARIAVDAKAAAAAADAENCAFRDVRTPNGGVSFTCLEKALPFPVSWRAVQALGVVPFQKELNQEVLAVANLAPGRYDVLIDNAVVATATAEELAQGINLADNPKTPMYKQALEVEKHEGLRSLMVMGPLRAIAGWQANPPQGADPKDYDSMKKAIEERVDWALKHDKPHYQYVKGQADGYILNKPKEAQVRADIAKEVDEIWKVNQPVPHTFVIRKSTAR